MERREKRKSHMVTCTEYNSIDMGQGSAVNKCHGAWRDFGGGGDGKACDIRYTLCGRWKHVNRERI